jgi:hypothetical protein
MSVRQNVRSAKRPSAKCPFGKMSFGKMSFGKVSFGKMSDHHILLPLGIAWKTKHIDNSQDGIEVEC